MCTICLMIDRDMPFPTPKELARNINEVLPTEEHLEAIKDKIDKKLTKHLTNTAGSIYHTDKSKPDEYKESLDKELALDLFPHLFHDLRNS